MNSSLFKNKLKTTCPDAKQNAQVTLISKGDEQIHIIINTFATLPTNILERQPTDSVIKLIDLIALLANHSVSQS